MKRVSMLLAALLAIVMAASAKPSAQSIKKLKDVVIYRDSMYYSAFPRW